SDIELAFKIAAEAGNTNNGAIDWTRSEERRVGKVLAAGGKAKLVSKMTVNDQHGGTDTATVTITITGSKETPGVAAADKCETGSVTELTNTTGSSPASGTIHFTDVDLTDRPTASITAQTVTGVKADGTTPLTLSPTEISDIELAFKIAAEAGNTNNGAIDWT